MTINKVEVILLVVEKRGRKENWSPSSNDITQFSLGETSADP